MTRPYWLVVEMGGGGAYVAWVAAALTTSSVEGGAAARARSLSSGSTSSRYSCLPREVRPSDPDAPWWVAEDATRAPPLDREATVRESLTLVALLESTTLTGASGSFLAAALAENMPKKSSSSCCCCCCCCWAGTICCCCIC